MPELLLHRLENTLEATFGEHHATIPWIDVAPDANTGQRIYDDAVAYGKNLFAKTFADEPLKDAVTTLQANERLVLVIDDPSVAAIPWEYLRDPESRLLAARLTLVRSVSEAQPQARSFTLPLHIIAIPVSPVDDLRVLDTEGEWQRVLAAVRKQSKALTLTRVRPPTLDVLERTLNSERTTIVHFMGHSDSRDGKGLLAFEEAHTRFYLIEAADFADTLAATNIFLVVLNSCRSAIAWDWTAFGNIARGLVREGVPYALGMQFVLPDDAALAGSQDLYDFLLQGRSIEEAVRRTRRTLEHNTTLKNPSWLAGIPVLYTSLREQSAAPLNLHDGQSTIQPDPERLQKTCELAALPQATHFVGRSKEISQALDALLAHRPANFVVLHGRLPSASAGITMTAFSPTPSRPLPGSMPTTNAPSTKRLLIAFTTAWPASTSLTLRSTPQPPNCNRPSSNAAHIPVPCSCSTTSKPSSTPRSRTIPLQRRWPPLSAA